MTLIGSVSQQAAAGTRRLMSSDDQREQYADQAERAKQSLRDDDIDTIGRNESKPTTEPLGGPARAPGPDATGLTTGGPEPARGEEGEGVAQP
jgi:hypothetical protein